LADGLLLLASQLGKSPKAIPFPFHYLPTDQSSISPIISISLVISIFFVPWPRGRWVAVWPFPFTKKHIFPLAPCQPKPFTYAIFAIILFYFDLI
jgi:hypothetical protein